MKRVAECLFLIFVIVMSFQPVSFAYTTEEQYVLDHLYLHLPWAAGVKQELTQENKDTPTHIVGSFDEYALDFGLIKWTPLFSDSSGMLYVYKKGTTNAPAYGNHIKLDHGYFYSLYAHLESFAPEFSNCENGCEVAGPGILIGYSGSTGVSFAPHLHYGLYYGSAWDDGYFYSVQSRITVGSEGYGPYQSINSTNFVYGASYLSENFQRGTPAGAIVCNENGCFVNNSGGVGGSGDPYEPLPNLHIENQFVYDSSNNLLADNGTGVMNVGSTYKVEVWPESLVEHCGNGTDDWTQEVVTDISWKIGVSEDDGEWELLQREYTTCEIMDEDDSKREDFTFVVPSEAAGKKIFIRAKTDVTNIIYETDEDDNWSDTETYRVSGVCSVCPNFTVSDGGLTEGRSGLSLNEHFGLEMDVLNQGNMASPSDIRSAYYTKKPSQSEWQYRADDGSGASNFGINGTEHEYTQDNPFTADEAGTWQALLCAEYPDAVSEIDESDNCFQFSFEVTDPSAQDESLRADVDGDGNITATDYSLIMSYSMGSDMNGTAWIDSPITGDANCSGSTTTTDALLVMRKVNGLSMEGTGWCVPD